MKKPTGVEHVAGKYVGMTQFCTRCGEKLVDYTRSAWTGGQQPPSGWAEGARVVVAGPVSSIREYWNGPVGLCQLRVLIHQEMP